MSTNLAKCKGLGQLRVRILLQCYRTVFNTMLIIVGGCASVCSKRHVCLIVVVQESLMSQRHPTNMSIDTRTDNRRQSGKHVILYQLL